MGSNSKQSSNPSVIVESRKLNQVLCKWTILVRAREDVWETGIQVVKANSCSPPSSLAVWRGQLRAITARSSGSLVPAGQLRITPSKDEAAVKHKARRWRSQESRCLDTQLRKSDLYVQIHRNLLAPLSASKCLPGRNREAEGTWAGEWGRQ